MERVRVANPRSCKNLGLTSKWADQGARGTIRVGQDEPGNLQRKVHLIWAKAVGKRGKGERSTGGCKADEQQSSSGHAGWAWACVAWQGRVSLHLLNDTIDLRALCVYGLSESIFEEITGANQRHPHLTLQKRKQRSREVTWSESDSSQK